MNPHFPSTSERIAAKKQLPISLAFVAFTATLALQCSSTAATITWDGSDNDADWSNPANWSSGALPTTLDIVKFVTGGFAGGGEDILLNGDKSVRGLNLSAATTMSLNYDVLTLGSSGIFQLVGNTTTLNTDGVVLSANQTWITGGTLNVVNGISGSFNLTKSGAGTLTLEGANTYGNTVVSNGTLDLKGSLTDTATVNLSTSTATLKLSNLAAASEKIGGLQGIAGSTVNLGSKTLIVSNAADYVFDGNILGTNGNFEKMGNATQTLTGTNTYTGITTISAGILQIGAGGTTGSLGTGAVVNNAALVIDRSNAISVANAISGSGSLTKQGAGNLTLTGTNSYSGGTDIAAGTLLLSGSGSLLDAGSVNLSQSGAGFSIAGITSGSETIATLSGVSGSMVSLGSKTLITSVNLNFMFGGDFSGTGNLQKQGSSIMTLSGNNSYSGNTIISSGSILLASSGALSPTANVTLSGGTLIPGSAGGTTSGSIVLTSSSVLDMGAGTSTLSFASANTSTWSGVLSIWNWSGAAWAAGTDSLIFNTSTLTVGQLASIQFYSDAGATQIGLGAGFLGGGSIVPAPEASTVLAILTLFGLVGYKERKLFLRARN